MNKLLRSYVSGETDPIMTIRILSSMFNPDAAIHLMALICSITRVEQGDLDKETFARVWKINEE